MVCTHTAHSNTTKWQRWNCRFGNENYSSKIKNKNNSNILLLPIYCIIVSLMQMLPDRVWLTNNSCIFESIVNAYKTSGQSLKQNVFFSIKICYCFWRVPKFEYILIRIYPLLINWIASNALSTVTIGKIGPKISSCITGSVFFTFINMVGSIKRSSAFVLPPNAIWPPFNNDTSRLSSYNKNKKQKTIKFKLINHFHLSISIFC